MLVSVVDVAAVFRVCDSTVRGWERGGKLPQALRTPGNHRRWETAGLVPLLRECGFPVPEGWEAKAGDAQ